MDTFIPTTYDLYIELVDAYRRLAEIAAPFAHNGELYTWLRWSSECLERAGELKRGGTVEPEEPQKIYKKLTDVYRELAVYSVKLGKSEAFAAYIKEMDRCQAQLPPTKANDSLPEVDL